MSKTDDVLNSLQLDFRIKTMEVIRLCADQDVTILPYCGLRTCAEQAKLFRRSRGSKEVEQKAQSFRDRSLNELAQVLLDVGPQPSGAMLTKSGPGESWHQYGLALDCVPMLAGKALWEADAKEWDVYGAAAAQMGLVWARNWKSFPEAPHIQLPPTTNPFSTFSTADAIKQLKECGSL